MDDTEIDDYIAQMLAKKAKQQKEKHDIYGNSVYLEPLRIPNTNKRFLLNTIRNTSFFNESLKKAEVSRLDRESKTMRKHETVKKKTREPSVLKSIEFDESNPSTAFSCRLKAMVQHSKLSSKTKRAKLPPGKTIIEAVLGSRIEDSGVYGPHQKKNDRLNVPNQSLPEKCPW